MTTVGPYTLLSKLGEGGMGVVHLARDPSGHQVALKVMRPQVVGDDEGRRRMAREVSSLERVRSRWIAEILDADPWGEVPYIATRYVAGRSLHDQVAEDGPIRGKDLLWLARCLAEGLAACHDVGVLHRDVKPSNVLMEGNTPILIDFGLARVADDPKITHTGWLLGTPGYLPPEILYGDDASTATDVHSWAATVAYAATGRAPYGKGPSTAIMERTRRGEHDLSGVPEPMDLLLDHCLAPEPAERPALDDVLAWLRDPSLPVPGSTAPVSAPTMVERAPAPTLVDAPPTLVDRGDAPPDPFAGYPVEHGYEPEVHRPAPAYEPDTPPRVSAAARFRRLLLWLGLGAVAAAGFAAFPWVTLVVLVLLVWLLRAGSYAASDVAARRSVRGSRWYDGPRMILRAPWDLVRSIPSSLVLILWAIGIAVAAGLLCYAVTLPLRPSYAVCGGVFAFMLWLGPGGNRVRSSVGRVVRPLSATTMPWAPAFLLLIAATAGLVALLATHGTAWFPFRDALIPALRD